jgi:hypothetical protein
MITPFVVFWTIMIFASIGWYGFLVFYVGYKGGREIKAMTKAFERRDANGRVQQSPAEPDA